MCSWNRVLCPGPGIPSCAGGVKGSNVNSPELRQLRTLKPLLLLLLHPTASLPWHTEMDGVGIAVTGARCHAYSKNRCGWAAMMQSQKNPSPISPLCFQPGSCLAVICHRCSRLLHPQHIFWGDFRLKLVDRSPFQRSHPCSGHSCLLRDELSTGMGQEGSCWFIV